LANGGTGTLLKEKEREREKNRELASARFDTDCCANHLNTPRHTIQIDTIPLNSQIPALCENEPCVYDLRCVNATSDVESPSGDFFSFPS